MATLQDHLTTYAAYHRDRRNIVTHCIGVPMIVVGIEALLARLALPVGGDAVASFATAATVATLLATSFYMSLDRRFGAVMAVLLGLALFAGTTIAAQPRGVWLTLALGLFGIGWVFQFIGHFFEGKKPAFTDDIIGLVIGPLFVTAEVGFAFGLRPDLEREISVSQSM